MGTPSSPDPVTDCLWDRRSCWPPPTGSPPSRLPSCLRHVPLLADLTSYPPPNSAWTVWSWSTLCCQALEGDRQ